MSIQDKNHTGSFKYNEGQETISGEFSTTQQKNESIVRDSTDSQAIQRKSYEAKTPSFAVSPDYSAKKLQNASVNNSYDFEKRDSSIQKIDDKSITIHGIKVVRTSEPKIQEQQPDKPLQNPAQYLLDEDRNSKNSKGLPQVTVTKQPINLAPKKNEKNAIIKKNAKIGFNSVKNNMIGAEKKSRQLLKDEIITLQGSNSRQTMNEDIAMYDIGLDAYKIGLDSTISEDKNSTIIFNSRNLTTNQPSAKEPEQTDRQTQNEGRQRADSNSNYPNMIQLPSLPENILRKNQSIRDLTQHQQYSLNHYSSSSDASRQNFIQIKQSYHQIFNDAQQNEQFQEKNKNLTKDEGIQEIKRIHSQLKMLNEQKKLLPFQDTYQSLQNEKFKDDKRILNISQSVDRQNKLTAKSYQRQFSLQTIKFAKPQKTSKELRERTNSQKQQMISQLKKQQDRYTLKTSIGSYPEAPHNLYQTNPTMQNSINDQMARQNSLINMNIDGLTSGRTNTSQVDSFREGDFILNSQDQQIPQKNLFHLKSKLAIPTKKSKFNQHTSVQRTPDTYRSLFKDGNQRSLMTADVGQNQSTDINSLGQESFIGPIYNTSVFSNKNLQTSKQLEKERKNIKKMLNKLDEKEILFWNEQEKVIKTIKEDNKDLGKDLVNMNQVLFQRPIEYFSLVQQALNYVILDSGDVETSINQSVGLGTKNESMQVYSNHFKKFIERICQSISISKQYFERNLEISFSFKDKQIHKASKIIEGLQANIEELQAKLIHEEDFLAEDRVKDMKKQVEEFLNSNPIGQDGAKSDSEVGQDIFDILKQNKYSGVKMELSEVMRQMKLGSKKKDDDQAQQFQFDLRLLDDNSFTFQQELEKDFIEKAKAVQLGTSKKVIKQFHKNAELIDVECQTGFKDDQFIKELEGNIVILKKDIENLRDDKASDQITIQGLRKTADDLNIKIISQQTQLKQTQYNLSQADDQFRAESKRAEKMYQDKIEAEEKQNKLTDIIRENQVKQQESDERISQLRQQMNDLSTQVRRQKQTIDDTESQNSQKVVQMEQQIKILEEKLRKAEADKSRKDQQMQELSKQVEKYKEKSQLSSKQLKDLQFQKDSAPTSQPPPRATQSMIVNPNELKSAGIGSSKQLSQNKSVKIDDLKTKQVTKLETTHSIVEEQSTPTSKGTYKNQNTTPMLTDNNSPKAQIELDIQKSLKDLDKNLEDSQTSWIDSMHQRKNTESHHNRTKSSLNKDLNIGDGKNLRNQKNTSQRKKPQNKSKTHTPGVYEGNQTGQNPISTLNQPESINSFGEAINMKVNEYTSSSRDGSQEESHAYMHEPIHKDQPQAEKQLNQNATISTIELEGNQNYMVPQYPSPNKKNWVLIQSQKELQNSDKQIDQLVQNKVSRIPYLDTPMQPTLISATVQSSPRVASLDSIQKLQRKKMVSKNAQTVINTETFISILDLQNQLLRQKRDLSQSNSVGVQCSRIHPPKQQKSKLQTGQASCFGQNVSEKDLERAQKIIEIEEKNRRIFCGSPKKDNKPIQIPTNQPYDQKWETVGNTQKFYDSVSTMQREFLTQEQLISQSVTKNPPDMGNNDHIATHQTNADLEHVRNYDNRPKSPSYQPQIEGDNNLFRIQGASPKEHIKKSVSQEKRSVGGFKVQSMDVFNKKFLESRGNEASTIQISPSSKGNLQVFKHQQSLRQNQSLVNLGKKPSRDQSVGSLKSNISGPLGVGNQMNAKLNVKTENLQSEHISNNMDKNDDQSK